MELDRWRSANKNSSDSWKQLIWLTISTNLKSAIEIFLYAERAATIHGVQYICMQKYHHMYTQTHGTDGYVVVDKINDSQSGKAGQKAVKRESEI